MMNFEIIPPITDKDCFAHRGEIRDLKRLKRTYGGTNWKKCKGFCNIKIENGIYGAEIHWYECHGIGAVEYKIKRFLEWNLFYA